MNEAELILNDDGSIYHLGIRPEHCAPLIITVGDPDRVPTVSQFFDRIDYINRKREICIHTGLLGSRAVSVISQGWEQTISILFSTNSMLCFHWISRLENRLTPPSL